MVAYLFAGQGSQYVGMGKDLYDAFPASKEIFDKADKVLGFSLKRLIFEGPQDELTETQNCQPAVLTMSIACWEAFRSLISHPPPVICYAAGLSLGEYSALVAAEALSFEDAVYLVWKRGTWMEEEASKLPGKMASVLGLDLESIRDISAQSQTEIANINSPGQIVLSGGIKEIEEATRLATQRGAKKVITLEVSGAFHSSFMSGASGKLAKELNKIIINAPKIPVISNVNAQPVIRAEQIRENLIKQITASVLWEDSMRFLISQGISNFIEFGPGKVLKGLMRRISADAQVRNIEKKEDISSLCESS